MEGTLSGRSGGGWVGNLKIVGISPRSADTGGRKNKGPRHEEYEHRGDPGVGVREPPLCSASSY